MLGRRPCYLLVKVLFAIPLTCIYCITLYIILQIAQFVQFDEKETHVHVSRYIFVQIHQENGIFKVYVSRYTYKLHNKKYIEIF